VFERYRRSFSIVVAVTDILLINIAVAIAYWLRYSLQWFAAVDEAYLVPYQAFVPMSFALTVSLLGIYKLSGVYDQPRGASWFDEAYRLFTGTATGIIVMVFIIVFFFRPYLYSRLIFFYAGVLITVLLSVSRLVQRLVRTYLRRRGLGVDRLLIVGAGEVGRTVMRNIVAHPGLGYQIVGFVDDDPDKATMTSAARPWEARRTPPPAERMGDRRSYRHAAVDIAARLSYHRPVRRNGQRPHRARHPDDTQPWTSRPGGIGDRRSLVSISCRSSSSALWTPDSLAGWCLRFSLIAF
jgi:hypothetical protein